MRPPAAVLLVLVAIAVPAAVAQAGTYSVLACGDASASTNNSWTPYNNAVGPGQLETGDRCSGSDKYGGLFSRDSLTCTSICDLPPSGAAAGWTFGAPAGTLITHLSYSRWLYKMDDDNWEPALSADGAIVETCGVVDPSYECSVGAERGARTAFAIPDATRIEVGIRCKANPYNDCVGGATLHRVAAVLYGATVTLSDPSAPTLSDVGGSVFGGGYLTGSRDARFSATDNAGIRSARLYVDGKPQAAATYGCDFTYAVPCSNRDGETLTLDTGALADGTHTIEVAASDPASNEARSAGQTITVDNTAPDPPEQLTVDGGGTQSTSDFTVRWTNPGGQVAPIASAHWQLCPTTGGACSSGEGAGEDLSQLGGVRAPSPGDYRLSLWLEDAAGNVASDASATTIVRFSKAQPTSTSTGGTSTGGGTPATTGASPVIDSSAPGGGGLDLATRGGQQDANARRSPTLRLTSARFANGRMTLRGRTGAGVSGQLLVTVRLGRRAVRYRRPVQGGAFRLVIRIPSPPRRISARYTGSERFLPAAASARVR